MGRTVQCVSLRCPHHTPTPPPLFSPPQGLGKTVQCVSLLGYLSEVLSVRGPFLVVVPLSVVPNWIREFRRWTPNINVVRGGCGGQTVGAT